MRHQKRPAGAPADREPVPKRTRSKRKWVRDNEQQVLRIVSGGGACVVMRENHLASSFYAADAAEPSLQPARVRAVPFSVPVFAEYHCHNCAGHEYDSVDSDASECTDHDNHTMRYETIDPQVKRGVFAPVLSADLRDATWLDSQDAFAEAAEETGCADTVYGKDGPYGTTYVPALLLVCPTRWAAGEAARKERRQVAAAERADDTRQAEERQRAEQRRAEEYRQALRDRQQVKRQRAEALAERAKRQRRDPNDARHLRAFSRGLIRGFADGRVRVEAAWRAAESAGEDPEAAAIAVALATPPPTPPTPPRLTTGKARARGPPKKRMWPQ